MGPEPSISAASRGISPAVCPQNSGTLSKQFSRDMGPFMEKPTTRKASHSSIRYSIASSPLIDRVKVMRGKDRSAAPRTRAALGGRPWTLWNARLKAVGES